jgi:RNA polymerase sigma-70 factor (ECF subfamily)
MISDEALMLEFRGGSREAFEEIFARYREPLHGFFRRRLDSRNRAEDLTQDTFVAVIRGAARYEPRAMLKTYLFGIAWKLLAAERRKWNSRVPAAPEPARAIPQAGNDAADEELWVRQALARLEPGERDVLMLREYDQLSYTEIAGLLRIPVNTVRSRLFRARMALKRNLEARCGDVLVARAEGEV